MAAAADVRRAAAHPRYRRSEQQATDEAHKWLDFVGLRGDRTGLVRHLPYGEQRRVEIARALARRRPCCCWTSPPPGSTTRRRPSCSA
ncbi:hypothetical protein ACFQY7_18090 [Actinomadura luteofluorescens]|uniref:hypothetical protein n=1 Tax=Actinomadura luteofluorescens TaxID=46163 RepID=UPI00363A5F1A